MNALLKHITLEPESPAQATVLWFHGLGADGNDFVPLIPQLGLAKTIPIRFVFPHAPVIPVSINGGYPMPAWFDITSLAPLNIDELGLAAAIRATHDLIQAEINKGISPDRIILAGFSQGGAVALSAALAYPDTLAGVIALSTFIPSTQLTHTPSKRFPIFMAHGMIDDVVPMSLGEHTFQQLKAQGFDISWKTYAMAHEVCKNEIADISLWLQEHLTLSQTL